MNITMARTPVREIAERKFTAEEGPTSEQWQAFARKTGKRKRPPSVSVNGWDKAKEDAGHRLGTGEWQEVKATTWVATYALLHEKVYGVAPVELRGKSVVWAAAMASKLLREEFDGDAGAMGEFIRWTWKRERGREEWRRAKNNGAGGRIGWKLQFGGALLTDYRLELARKADR